METPRKILHLDLDAFFCAVEEKRDPTLKGIPFAVGGSPDARGVVASCSYAARRLGVRSAMPMSRARRLCAGLVIVRWRHTDYRAESRRVMAILHDLTPWVEQLSIDEAFLDLSELPDDPAALARNLQARIGAECGLPCSLGAASNKLVAKIANNIGKSSVKTGTYPNAITVVPPGQEAAFLAPLPAGELWGVGPKTAEKLAALGLHTIGDIAAFPAETLVAKFGKYGADIARHARGLDERPIITEHAVKSISRETTYDHDTRDPDQLAATLAELAEQVAAQLHKQGLYGKTVTLKLRWSDFTTLTRQITLNNPVNSAGEILPAALGLLAQHRPPEQRVRLIGVGVSGFTENPVRQLSLWE